MSKQCNVHKPYSSVFFSNEGAQTTHSDRPQRLRHVDPNTHPLFGIALDQYAWPEQSEYQTAYSCPCDRPSHRDQCQGVTCGNNLNQPPFGQYGQGRPSDAGNSRSSRHGTDINKLYDPTPLPLLDKHFRGYYYRIDDPIGVVTREEVTKCKENVLGLQTIRTQDEMENTFVPNYRYKEWATQPQLELVKQMDYFYPMCRLPPADTRYTDLYHQVRMNRPSPPDTGDKFGVCKIIPIPMK